MNGSTLLRNSFSLQKSQSRSQETHNNAWPLGASVLIIFSAIRCPAVNSPAYSWLYHLPSKSMLSSTKLRDYSHADRYGPSGPPHRGTAPITVDLNACQKPSWSLTYALIFYCPFRSDQQKTLIKSHVTAIGATARRPAHSFSLISPFLHFCIRYRMLSVLEYFLRLNCSKIQMEYPSDQLWPLLSHEAVGLRDSYWDKLRCLLFGWEACTGFLDTF